MNEALPGLLLGILVYGVIVELIGVFFVKDPLRYSTGLWTGVFCAMGMAIHIASIIQESVRLGGTHTKRMSFFSVLRYLVVAGIFFLMMYLNWGSLIPGFLGLLGLKVSAYAQPFFHKTTPIGSETETGEVKK